MNRHDKFSTGGVMKKFYLVLVGVIFNGSLFASPYNSLSVTGNWAIGVYQKLISPLQGREICNFSPSCSNFSKQAINKYGMFWGVVMTADRLERCNFAAWSYFDIYYFGIVNDRLYDPIENHSILAQAPVVVGNPSPASLTAPVEHQNQETDFADFLFGQEDYLRSAAEYKRTLFTSTDASTKAYARFMTGESFLRTDSLASALKIFSTCKTQDSNRAMLYDYETARTFFLAGNYPKARQASSHITGDLGYQAKILSGWSFFKERNFRAGARVFKADAILGELANFNGHGISSRSRAAATAFSLFIPGLGQTYAGRLGDGLFSLMTITTFGAAAYYYYKTDEPLKFSFLGALALVFWAGNVYGANLAARDYNELQKREYLSRIEALLGTVNLAPDYRSYFQQ